MEAISTATASSMITIATNTMPTTVSIVVVINMTQRVVSAMTPQVTSRTVTKIMPIISVVVIKAVVHNSEEMVTGLKMMCPAEAISHLLPTTMA